NLPNLVLVIEPTAVEEPPVVEQPPQQLVTAPQSVETRFIVGSPSFTVNGVPRTDAEGLAPFIDPEYDRTMMPLRLIAEIFGAEVSWNEETRTAIIISGGITLQIPLDTPLPDGLGMPSIVNDRAFVPLRYIAENLGVQVEWDGVNQAIYIRQ
ncbi:MAG: copper amine oxidase N-terminal domain-containing protein, partial [Turicibacter sp.]|nr:copper amine oxidase N-terminal domain-containing protein [Turicibacter sp.]